MEIVCPYCGETIAVFIDEGGGPMQRYVEDCSVCCRPIELAVDETQNGDFSIVAAGLYLAWIRFAPSRAPSPASSGDATPAANTQHRIDALSGSAPAE